MVEALVEVQTSLGVFKLKKPTAGQRNKALLESEKSGGRDKDFSMIAFMCAIIPKCIANRPESCDKDVPIDQLLDNMEQDDYDKIFLEVSKLIRFNQSVSEEKKTP